MQQRLSPALLGARGIPAFQVVRLEDHRQPQQRTPHGGPPTGADRLANIYDIDWPAVQLLACHYRRRHSREDRSLGVVPQRRAVQARKFTNRRAEQVPRPDLVEARWLAWPTWYQRQGRRRLLA